MAAIFFDIDGTLWDRQNVIPDSTKAAFERLHENGHQTFICSGRSLVMIQDENLLRLGFDGILAGCGTQLVYHGKTMYYHLIEPSLVKHCVSVLRECGMAVMLESEDRLFMDSQILENEYGKYVKDSIQEAAILLGENHDQWIASKLCVLLQGGNVERAVTLLDDAFEFLVHGSKVMEVLPKGFGKARGIAKTCELLGISHEETYAFGDSINDQDMLQYAACGIAMGNGTEDAKRAADYITSDIHEDGIYRALEHFNLI